MPENDSQPIGIKELISRVKQELLQDHDDTDPLLVISQVELEISFTVNRNIHGGLDLKVVQTGAEKSWEETQRIKVCLDPIIGVDEIRDRVSSEQKEQAQKAVLREARFD